MINFILYEDSPRFLKELENIITKYMMSLDIEYKIHSFSGYNETLKKLIEKDCGFKVYLLDIETKDKSGLDLFRFIREEANDWHSLVLFITNHNEMKYEALSNRLYLFDFINKLDDAKKHINLALDRIINYYNTDNLCLKIRVDNALTKISYKDIISISKEKNSNRCLIKTSYEDYCINSSISKIFDNLNKDFIKINFSHIVNLKHIKQYDKKNNCLIFSDGSKSFDVSRNNKKKLVEHFD